jgi:hypothetical protein
MEYLEGTTLADRLARGRLPVGQSLRIGIEIADGSRRPTAPASSTVT